MGLPRTFVGFSSTDIKYYWLMLAWKENEHIDFNFTDCQLSDEIRSEDEQYIKSKKSLEGRFPYFTPIYWILCNSIKTRVLETRQGIVSLSFDILSKVGDAFCHQK